MINYTNINFTFFILAFCLLKNIFILTVLRHILPGNLMYVSLGFDFALLTIATLLVLFYRAKCYLHLIILLVFAFISVVLSERGLLSMLQVQRIILLPAIAIVISHLIWEYNAVKVTQYLKLIIIIYMLFIFFEILFMDFFYSFVDVNYWNVMKGFDQDIDYVSKMRMRVGEYVVPRIIGPSLHPITTGYVLCFSAIFLQVNCNKIIFQIIISIVFIPLIMLTSKGALATYFCVMIVALITKKESLQNVIIAVYLACLLFLSSFPITSGYTHFHALKSAFNELPANIWGSYSGYLFKYDTFLALIVHNFGIIGIAYFGYMLWFIQKLKLPGRLDIYRVFLKVIWLNSILHIEPVTISSFFIPFFYVYFLKIQFDQRTEND